jgi:hypothetical protein
MTHETRRVAGILLILLPSVIYGGLSILWLLIDDPAYMKNPLRQDLWRAGHSHAGVWLILALVALRYVDEANLSDALKRVVRISIPDPGPGWVLFLGGLARCNGPQQSHQPGPRGRRCAGNWRLHTRRRPDQTSKSRQLNVATHQ